MTSLVENWAAGLKTENISENTATRHEHALEQTIPSASKLGRSGLCEVSEVIVGVFKDTTALSEAFLRLRKCSLLIWRHQLRIERRGRNKGNGRRGCKDR